MPRLQKKPKAPPKPIVSSFTPPDMTRTYVEPTVTYLTPDQLAEVIAKNGAPTMLLSSRRTLIQQQRQSGKKKAKV